MKVRYSIKLFGLLVIALVALGAMALMMPGGAKADPVSPQGTVTEGTYENPLQIVISGTGALTGTVAETWADPAVIKGSDGYYYAYATTDALSNADRDGSGNWNFHKIPMARSNDLVHWTYLGDAFSSNPSWAETSAGLWAPDIRYFNGLYYLYYVVTDVKQSVSNSDPADCPNDNAIGVATSPNPYGPWTDSGQPVVYPRPNGGTPTCNFFWTYDPAVIEDANGNRYIYFGSYYGGIFVRQLSKDGVTSIPSTEVQVTIANRYEGAYVVSHDGYYYLFGSATDCCRGPLTGYSVFVGRSTSPLGPFVDRLGVPLTETRVGGTPVISMNGNKWMGTGHNAVITDEAGQDWFFYHAIDRGDAYLDPDPADTADPDPYNINKRPMLMDRLSWINGWPSVRSGYWASDSPQPAPVTAAGGVPQPTLAPKPIDVPAAQLPEYSDEFNGALESQWGWVRQPPSTTYSLTEHPGFFRFRTQQADLYEGNNSASVLTETAPAGEFMVETKFEFNLPPSNCCFNYQQAGIVLYQDDDHYVKLDHFSLWETRQTEWAKETGASDPDRARNHTYGNTVISSPGQPGLITTTTWLRIVKRIDGVTGQQYYTGYVSFNGFNWDRGATWTHNLTNIKIGLIAMGRSSDASDPNDYRNADFDYVRVYTLAPTGATATAVPSSSSTSTTVPSSTSTSTSTSTTVA
ncbi:MAG TPA: family 43 glycosylhydrolase, partial [Chloroflexia bacterium]|nr:family 43 glycosylhydrolase [Chloroflexia bacterium]